MSLLHILQGVLTIAFPDSTSVNKTAWDEVPATLVMQLPTAHSKVPYQVLTTGYTGNLLYSFKYFQGENIILSPIL